MTQADIDALTYTLSHSGAEFGAEVSHAQAQPPRRAPAGKWAQELAGTSSASAGRGKGLAEKAEKENGIVVDSARGCTSPDSLSHAEQQYLEATRLYVS